MSTEIGLAEMVRVIPDAQTSGARSALGENLMARKQYAAAEPLLIPGYNGLREREVRIPAANKPRLEKAAQRLIRIYQERARPDKAAEWRKRLGEAGNVKNGAD